MDHESAVTSHAVERFFLGEMAPDERDAFEEHFFLCELCGDDVRATSAFIENTKSIFSAAPPSPGRVRRPWFAWLRPALSYSPAYAAAAAVFLIMLGYQDFKVIPALKAPQAVSSGVVLDGPTRSAVPKLRDGESPHFEVPWDRRGPAYVELLHNSAIISSGEVEPPAPSQPLDVLFPVKLKPGRYRVVVRDIEGGEPAQELMQSDFEVIPQETNGPNADR